MHRSLRPLASSLAFAVLALPNLCSAAVIPVQGHDDAVTDRPALQDALDRAEPGDTVLLSGTFQLDGQRVLITTAPLTLLGEVLDADGDGLENEDWLDGIDNDGDGRVDEDGWDAVIRGLTNPDGSLARDPDPTSYFNRGLALQGVTGTAERVAIRHLKFEHHIRAINLEPEIDAPNDRCEESTVTGGLLVGVDLRHNFFTDNERGIQGLGAVENLRIHQNLFLGNHAVDLLFVGGLRSCVGTAGSLPLGTPTDVHLTRNRILDSNIGIFTDHTRGLLFQGNTIDEVVLGIFTRSDEGVTIKDNDVSRSFRAVTTSLPATDAAILGNRISAVSDVGIILLNRSAGYAAGNNRFDGSGSADIRLGPTTTDNTVIALPGVRVIDLGTGNHVVLRGDENDG